MLSWNDDVDVFSKRPSMVKAGSLPRSGNSIEAQRTGSSFARKSIDAPAAPCTLSGSPGGSLNNAHSLLRAHGHATEGTIGAEGWWHHMDHGQMNDAPVEGKKVEGAKPPGFTPQYGISGEKQSLWADEMPSAAASPAVAPVSAFAAAAAQPTPQTKPADGTSPAGSAAAAGAPGSSPPVGDGPATIQNAGTKGWWSQMDHGALNEPVAAIPPGADRAGERAVAGGFTPQFNVAGGNHYGSLFEDDDVEDKASATAAKPLEQQVGSWAPFKGEGQEKIKKSGEDSWSNFTAAS